MSQPNSHLNGLGQWFADFGIDNGIVTAPPSFVPNIDGLPVSDFVASSSATGQPAAPLPPPGPLPRSGAPAAGLAKFTPSLTPDINAGLAGAATPAVQAAGAPLITNATSFTNGSATATSASDLNALITAADNQVTAGTLTIDVNGSLSLDTLPAVPDGEIFVGGKPTLQTAVPDIAAVNLHSGVSLVIVGGGGAILDGGGTVRGLFAYAGNLTVDNLTIQNTVAQGGAGANAGFAGGGGAGLGGGLFVAQNANVTLNSVSFSNTKAIGGAGGANTGGATEVWGGGGGLGGNGGFTDGGLYFGGGGGVGRTAFGGNGSYKAVTNYGHTDDSSLPGPGIIIGGASGGAGAPIATSDDPHTSGGINGGGGGMSEGTGHNASFPSASGYYGAGAGGGGVGGHNGYSKLSPYNGKETAGGGGDGGFGGGGGAGYYYGGTGGFGGGGGAGQYKYGGNGGFGGGGGGLPNTGHTLAQGGFGGGNAGGGPGIGNGKTPQYADSGGDAGGGGLGAGGAVFVQSGGVLTFGGAGAQSNGGVVAGAGGVVSETDGNGTGTQGTAGAAFGSGIFIQNNNGSVAQGVTFSPASGQTLTIGGVIADEKGSGGTSSNATEGKVVVQGGGTIRLTGSNTFAGGSSITGGSTLDLGGTHAAGGGGITFNGGGRLLIESGAQANGTELNNTVTAVLGGDAFDFSGLAFHTGATATIVSNTLSVISNGVTDTVSLASPGSNLGLVALQDAGTGTEVLTTNFTISTEAQLLTDLGLIDSGGADAGSGVTYTFDFLNAVPIVTGGETLNLLAGSALDYTGTGFTTGGTMTVTAGTLAAEATGALGSGALSIGASGVVALNGFSQTIGGLSGAGAVTLGGATLTEGTSGSTTFSGSIGGAGALVKQGSGTLTLSGANSFSGGLSIGAGEVLLGASGAAEGSTGNLTVAAGATLAMAGFNQTVGALSGAGAITLGAGTLTEGNSSSTSFTGVISGGGAVIQQGTGTLTVSGANSFTGGLSINAGEVLLGASGAAEGATGNLTVTAGTLALAGFNQTVAALSGAGSITLGSGTLTAGTGTSTSFTGSITGTGAGALIKQGTGTFTLSGNNSLPGGLTIDAGQVDLASATAASGGGTITFANPIGDVLEFSPSTVPGNVIAGFVDGHTLDVNMTGTTVTGATIVNTNTLQIALSSGGPLDVTLSPAEDWVGITFNHTTSGSDNFITDDAPCYCSGTRITTSRGEVAVEDLRIGDHVVTLSGSARPIKWIGCRHLDLSRHRAPERVTPIVIRAGAIADGMPRRDLRVSPDHAVLMDGVLVLARLLVNGATIKRDNGCVCVTYYHVELETHDILRAEGLPAESYLDTGNRGMFENSGAPLILHPDFDVRSRAANSCVPFDDDAATLEPIWRRLATRAAILGLRIPAQPETTRDPGLHVVVSGRVIEPVSADAGRYAFPLPRSPGPVRLVSRAASPCERRPWVEDRRRLGVMVSRLMLRHGAGVEPVPLDHPKLSRGWWRVEGERGALWRWTDGDAVLPLPDTGPGVLEVTVTGCMDYPVDQPRVAPDRSAGHAKAA